MKCFLAALLLLCLTISCAAQQLGTGSYPFATFDNHGFDSVNVGNLNVRFSVPIVSRSGRGLPFNYALQYEGLVWAPSNASGTGTWVPDPTWGFTGLLNGTALAGYLTHNEFHPSCPPSRSIFSTVYSNFRYHDAYGGVHRFNYSAEDPCPGDEYDGPYGDGSTNDNSGYSLNLADTTQVLTKSGYTLSPALSATGQNATSVTDANGNYISANGTGSFTDTLGATALTVSGSNPRVFTYPLVQQGGGYTNTNAQLSYQNYTVRTNFKCSGIVDYGSNTVALPDRLTFIDGSYYAFTYEGTADATDGAVTGRLASVRLPTGGVISYSYTAGCGAGINADGTVGSLTRTTSDGIRQYNRAPNNGNSTFTDVIDEKGNDTHYAFSIDSATGRFFETHKQVYQGGSSQSPLLLDVYTCYNGAPANCDGGAIALPFSQVNVITSYNGGSQTQTKNTYDTNSSLLLTSALLDPSNTLSQVVNSYDSQGNLTDTTTKDGNGTAYVHSYFVYDEGSTTSTPSSIPQHGTAGSARGNLTSSHTDTGHGWLTSSNTYYDTGQLATSTAVDGGVTTYTYDSTQGFVTSTALPTPVGGVAMTTSAEYDASTAAILSSTGMNTNETTTVNTYDGLMRPIKVTLPSGSQVTTEYDGARHIITRQTLDANRLAISEVQLDAYGRTSRLTRNNGRADANSNWYQVDYCYDATGLLSFQSTPYIGSGLKDSNGNDTVPHCSGSGTSYSYDALGRGTSVTTDDGTSTTQYQNRAQRTQDVNGVQRITQYDLMGRVSGVCEITGNTLGTQSPANCGMDIAGTGFLTAYSYDTVHHITTISQGGQTRTFATDFIGQPVSTSEPERGNTGYVYAYNSTGLQVQRTRPSANQGDANTHTHTTTQYDLLGRVTSVSYDDGITPTKTFTYDQATAWGAGSLSLGASKGRLTQYSASTSPNTTSGFFVYDVAGNIVRSDQCLPSGCGSGAYEHAMGYGYDLVGSVTSADLGAASLTETFSYSNANEITAITTNSHDVNSSGTLVGTISNGPYGPTSFTFGNGRSEANNFDSMGRHSGSWVCIGAPSVACSLQTYGWAIAYKGARLTSASDDAMGQGFTFGYDDFNRLTSVSGGNYGRNYSYDRWGNRTGETVTAGGAGSQPQFSFDSHNHVNGYSYDAAGNVTGDGLHSYTYDADGNLVKVDNGSTAIYTYDAFNRRVRVDRGSQAVEFLFNPQGQRTAFWDGHTLGQLRAQYYWGAQPLAYATYNHHYQHSDWLGTQRVQTDVNGNTEAVFSSMPFGEDLSGDSGSSTYGGTTSNQDAAHFAGLDHDFESGTDHAQFRQYSSTQGRWMSPDPYDGSYDFLNPQSFNRYSYVLNNPLGGIDPLGLYVNTICTGGEAAFVDGVLDSYTARDCFLIADGYGYGNAGYLAKFKPPAPNYGGRAYHPLTAPNKTTCKTGFGAGITIGADAGAGVGPLGAGANGSVGAGVFGGNGINAGAFASGGAAARSFGNLASAAGSMIHNFFAGAGGGVGGGLFLTNASQASQLSGQSQTYNVDLGYFANGSGQFSIGTDAAGNEIWSFSFQVGVGGAGLFHAVTNKTVTAGRKGGC